MNKNKMKHFGLIRSITLFIYVCTVSVLVSCSGKSSGQKDDRVITVTIEPQRYFTEAIAGDKFKVVSMVPTGSSPESYDPTPRQLVSLNESEAYFRIGYIGFEVSWMDRLIENTPHLKVFDLSKGVDLIHEQGHSHGDYYHVGGVEPHIWNSTDNAKIIAGNILKALVSMDVDNEKYYQERHDSLVYKIEETDREILNILNQGADRAFMIYHPALSYFARDYGLLQISIEEEGKEPTPAHMRSLIDISRVEKVGVIFIQPGFDKRNAEVVANELGIKVVEINPLSYDWQKEMIHTANSLLSK